MREFINIVEASHPARDALEHEAIQLIEDDDLNVDDLHGDVQTHPYEFARGYADENLGVPDDHSGMTMAEAGAYNAGRTEAKIRNGTYLGEKAPPGKKAKRFLKKTRGDFKKRYGDHWKQAQYATAWKMFGESQDTEILREQIEDLRSRIAILREFKMRPTPKEKRGMFKGWSRDELHSELADVRARMKSHRENGERVPHALRSRFSQLTFALRAKSGWGKAE